ncbi:MAG TPA: peptidylprolyl isomerase [Candidatus Tumulicola sp.]|nr:peptidylprolyl isomerase [Candidatus Tumulicola sp.]
MHRVKPAGEGAAVYVLRCADGSLYTGATTDLARRLATHRRGTAAKYTRSRLPVSLIAWWNPPAYDLARSHEARFKRMTRAAKTALLAADEAFGYPLRKAPSTAPPIEEEDRRFMPYTPPQPDELESLKEEARTSRVRIATDKGDIVVTLFPDDAPVHSAAFLKLAKAGFYDGLAFHRVEPGFVIQGGDPDGDGTGGPGYRLHAEFNARPHLRGTLAMARASDPNSAGSQFYLCLDDARFLDGQYTVFGTMTDGFEALDQIRRGDKMRKLTIEPNGAPASG